MVINTLNILYILKLNGVSQTWRIHVSIVESNCSLMSKMCAFFKRKFTNVKNYSRSRNRKIFFVEQIHYQNDDLIECVNCRVRCKVGGGVHLLTQMLILL